MDRKTVDPDEAPEGFYAVLKDVAKPSGGVNICRACDWRKECQSNVDFSNSNNRCMDTTIILSSTGQEVTRKDGCSVVFKRRPI